MTGPSNPPQKGSRNVETFISSRVCAHCGKGLPSPPCRQATAVLFAELPGQVSPGAPSA